MCPLSVGEISRNSLFSLNKEGGGGCYGTLLNEISRDFLGQKKRNVKLKPQANWDRVCVKHGNIKCA